MDAVYQFYQSVKEYFFIQNTKWLVRLINEHDDCLNHKKLRHQKTELNYWVDNLDKPIKIFVVGEGNFGKSTLINAIIQGAVAPVNFLPTTWCIHRYLPGENRAELYYAGGEKVQATIEEARECITAEEKRQKNGPSYISQLCQVDWYYSQYPVLNKFVLVDTPGLFQVRLDRIKKSIEEYYYQADAVLWLFDATKINRENSYKALRQVSRFSKKIIGVINKWDMVSAGSQERILRQAQDSFGEYVPIFQPVSAKQAWLAVEKQQSGLYEESLVPKLLERVKHVFLTNCELGRNINLYYSSRQVFAEAEKVLKKEHETACYNLALYDKNIRVINESRGSIYQVLASSFRSEFDNIFNQICQEVLQNVTLGNAENYLNDILLENGVLGSKIELIYSRISEQRDREINTLIQKLWTEKYQDCRYDYDGSVLDIDRISCLNSFPELVPLVPTIKIEINVSTWSKIKEWLAGTWVARSFIGSLFNLKEKVEQEQYKLREQIVGQLKREQKRYLQEAFAHLDQNIHSCLSQLRENADQCFEHLFGGREKLVEVINLTKQRLDLTKLSPSPFLQELFKLLKKGVAV